MPDNEVYAPSQDVTLAGGITLHTLQGYFRTWASTTQTARMKMRQCYYKTEGNGKQWDNKPKADVERSGRPALEFNQILPQVELVAGIQRSMQLDMTAIPRGHEDVRLAEITTATLRAVKDFTRLQRVSDRVFDDGTICGLGAWEVLHTNEDAEDLVWGDISVRRINPMSFIYDPWALDDDLQDGCCMGTASWVDVQTFKNRYPKFANLATPGEWLSRWNANIGNSDDLGTGPNLQNEVFDLDNGRIRLLTMWYKVQREIAFLVDSRTGMVKDVKNKAEGEAFLAEMKGRLGREAVAPFSIMMQDTESQVVHAESGQLLPDPQTGLPMRYASPEAAQARLNSIADAAGMQAYEQFKVLTRKARVPFWSEMVYWQQLDGGHTQFYDRKYPYVPYISRKYSDDPESVLGIVQNLIDPQDEYNKRYSQLLAHLNTSAHSGWLNPKAGGADTKKLEQIGSKPGIVVEYTAKPPQKIEPSNISPGHFALLQTSERNILRISGINAEMVGMTEQATVSGRAIRARQEGGSTILKPRFRTFEEAQLDLSRMLLCRVKQYYPAEKIRRIIGSMEANGPLGPNGMPLFADPVTGMPVPEEMILAYLNKMKNVEFDLVLRLAPASASDREANMATAMQMISLLTAGGRPVGPSTFDALLKMADLPSQIAEGLRRDMMLGVNPLGMQLAQQQNAVASKSANKSGGAQGDKADGGNAMPMSGGPEPTTQTNPQGGGGG